MKRDLFVFAQPPSSATGAPTTWRASLVALALAVAWIVACFGSTAATMVRTWANTETYAHGFVVVPISAWLLWRMRERIRAMVPEPSWFAIPPFAAAGVVWLLGEFGTVNVVSQAAFVAMLVLTVPALLGWRIARTAVFPLAFLFFAVPVGDFLLPALMDGTADFTVAALRATGVPVYREGFLLVLPTGSWSIIEACSGIRYLIASVMVGTLFAYLTYRALWRRLAFVGVAIVVPIVANWLRAYMIVMLGHLSNNRIATGVDHLVYGWIFFGIVMVLMFWIGMSWAEKPSVRVDARAARPATSGAGRSTPARSWLVLPAILASTLAVPLLHYTLTHDADRTAVVLRSVDVPGWTRVDGPQAGYVPIYNAPDATLQQTFRRGDMVVGLFVAYYRNQTSQRKLVSAENTFARSTDRTWRSIAHGRGSETIADRVISVDTTRLRGIRDDRALTAWRWYWLDGVLTSNDIAAKALTAWMQLRGRSDDSAGIVVYAPDADPRAASEALRAFVHDAWPSIDAALRAADSR
jgi:exosortase A